jgi:hypothetical protein
LHAFCDFSCNIQAFDNPIDYVTQRFFQHRASTFANRCQLHRRPLTQTCFIQFPYQKRVRQHHEVGVSCLPLAASHLTISQSQFLLAVSMKRFRTSPPLLALLVRYL